MALARVLVRLDAGDAPVVAAVKQYFLAVGGQPVVADAFEYRFFLFGFDIEQQQHRAVRFTG